MLPNTKDLFTNSEDAKDLFTNTKDLFPDSLGVRPWRSDMFTNASSKEKEGVL